MLAKTMNRCKLDGRTNDALPAFRVGRMAGQDILIDWAPQET